MEFHCEQVLVESWPAKNIMSDWHDSPEKVKSTGGYMCIWKRQEIHPGKVTMKLILSSIMYMYRNMVECQTTQLSAFKYKK